ncbi:class I adenylate-forming enzyme family protein [Halomarina halobia]|uniref:Class I adenylate-forming enzyme family protein n=1 Tax=Halomarina halobia TaxID=3033386 RepID=A0ABD6AEK9_9EURY|nr:AMP-binding protein [Halomarina sp. PSR21]
MRGLTFGHVAETNARKYPDGECLVVETAASTERLTFSEFNQRADQAARVLEDFGIEKGDRVAVYMQNNVETLETYYGAMKLGALPMPVNHRFKDREVRYVLRDSGAELIVFDDDVADTVGTLVDQDTPVDEFLHVGDERPNYAEDFTAARKAASTDRVEVVPGRLDNAALMYTSGTTGDPKGCVLTHDNLIQNSVNTVYSAGFEETNDSFLVVTPLFHIAAFGLFNNTFYTGSRSYVVEDFDPVRTMEIIEAESITGSFFVPTMSRALLAVDDFDSYDVASFQYYMTGAAPSGKELKAAVTEAFDAEFYEVFGQTEMSPVTTILHPEDALRKPGSIGKPIINVSLKVVNEEGEEVVQGDVGRAAYKGPTAFREYLGMPEKTAEVFDDGWFVSSDLVRRDEDGFFHFVGRADDMLITGGENVHPAEIEEVLHEHELISEAAVVGVPDENWGERVKAVIVLEDGATLTAEEVTTYVEARLADFKKPREVQFRDDLPRNPTGKVIKAQLE